MFYPFIEFYLAGFLFLFAHQMAMTWWSYRSTKISSHRIRFLFIAASFCYVLVASLANSFVLRNGGTPSSLLIGSYLLWFFGSCSSYLYAVSVYAYMEPGGALHRLAKICLTIPAVLACIGTLELLVTGHSTIVMSARPWQPGDPYLLERIGTMVEVAFIPAILMGVIFNLAMIYITVKVISGYFRGIHQDRWFVLGATLSVLCILGEVGGPILQSQYMIYWFPMGVGVEILRFTHLSVRDLRVKVGELSKQSANLRDELTQIHRVENQLFFHLTEHIRTQPALHENKQTVHDLKSPLTSLGIIGDRIKSGQIAPNELTRYAEVMVRSIERVTQLLERLQGHKTDQSAANFRSTMNVIVREVIESTRPQLESEKIQLDMQLGSDLPQTDYRENYVYYMVQNLIINAKDAIVAKRASDPHCGSIQIITAGNPERTILTVADDGIGMSKDHLDRIQTSYFSTKQSSGGTGLGMDIIRRAVEVHRGTLDIISKVNGPTEIRVMIPNA